MTRFALLTAFTLFVLRPTAGHAAEPELVTDRPDQTESALTVPVGTWQLETGWLIERSDEAGTTHQAPTTLVRIALREGLELRLGWPGWQEGPGPADGVGDPEVGFKLRLPDLGPATAALLGGITLPWGSDEVSARRAEPSLRLALAAPITEGLDLGVNLGASAVTVDEAGSLESRAAALYTVALGRGLGERAGVFVEAFGDIPLDAPGGPRHGFDAGLTYRPRPLLQFDLAAGVGLGDHSDERFVTVGLSWRGPLGGAR